MKTPPDNPEFRRLAEAMKTIMSVSKNELRRRERSEQASKEKRRSKRAVSPSSVSSPKPAN
jgi:hypothetical protein